MAKQEDGVAALERRKRQAQEWIERAKTDGDVGLVASILWSEGDYWALTCEQMLEAIRDANSKPSMVERDKALRGLMSFVSDEARELDTYLYYDPEEEE